jgi:general secretion pathway protein D
VLRNIHRPDFGQPALSSGTESAVGAAPLTVRAQGPKSLGVAPRGGVATAAIAPGPAAVTPIRAPEAPERGAALEAPAGVAGGETEATGVGRDGGESLPGGLPPAQPKLDSP